MQGQVFTVLWALGHLAHVLRKGDRGDPWMWMVMVAAVLLLQRPSSWRRILTLVGVQLPYLYFNLPATDNHLIIMGFANLGILVAVVRSRAHHVSEVSPVVNAPLVDSLPFLRSSLLLAYGAAALAKLNSGFFDLEYSCAVTMTEDALEILGGHAPTIPESIVALLPGTVAGLELAIPLLLLFRPTRIIGVVTVVFFHLAMSFSPTATAGDFTVVLFALVFLYLPARASGALIAPWHRICRFTQRFVSVSGTTWTLLLLALVAALVGRGLGPFNVAGNRNWVWVAGMGLVLGGLLLNAAFRTWREGLDTSAPLMPGSWWYLPILLLVALTAAAPYVGSKTISVFTMYSNLQTEDQESNHFLIPRLPRQGSQDDLVVVEESSNTRLQEIGDSGRLISWHELRRVLADDPTASIRFVRNGETLEYGQASDNPELVTTSWPAHRFIQHRIYEPDHARCLW